MCPYGRGGSTPLARIFVRSFFIHLLNCMYPIRKLNALFYIVALLVTGCGRDFVEKVSFRPEVGDLLFQDLDCGAFCDAIEKVTTGYKGANFTHIGIVAKNESDELVVLEAKINGVQITALNVFLNISADRNGQPKVAVGRLKEKYRHLIQPAVEEGFSLIGKDYDKVFDINNDNYYCSELIYKIFLKANNNRALFELQPMTFNDPNTGKIFGIWQDYFDKLGVAVPQGQNGINAGGISRSPIIDIIYSYSNTIY